MNLTKDYKEFLSWWQSKLGENTRAELARGAGHTQRLRRGDQFEGKELGTNDPTLM
jgi:hypothetical protein